MTGIFTPDLAARDPRGRGSLGAGIVLARGVSAEVRWDPTGPARVRLRANGRIATPISRAVARRLTTGRAGTFDIRLRQDLPVGQGLGSSAAGALATGLAVARVLGLPRARAVATAHLADLFGGGGLGGVASILGGGWERRRVAGIPPWGQVVHRPFRGPVWVVVLGPPIASPRHLHEAEFLRRVERAARPAMRRLDRAVGIDRVLEESERFSDALDLGTARVRNAVRRFRSTGARSGQAMLGHAVWAVPLGPRARVRLLPEIRKVGGVVFETRGASRGAGAAAGPAEPGTASVLNRPRLARLP